MEGVGRFNRRRSSTATEMAKSAYDAKLLLASLEQAPVEDEAEIALLNVLERRQVTFDAALPYPSAHRRLRTATTELPSMDTILNDTSPVGRSPLTGSFTRPPLARRAVSRDDHLRRSKSRAGGRLVGLQDSFTSGLGDIVEQLYSSDNVSADNAPIPSSNSEDREDRQGIASVPRPRPGLTRGRSARFHRRVIPLPAGLDPAALDPSQQVTTAGLTDAGERSLFIAKKMQNDESEDAFGDAVINPISEATGLADLLSIMEVKRDVEHESNKDGGNSRGSRGSRSMQGGSRGSRNGGSLFSGGASGARSRGESSGARRGRPFLGVSSMWSSNTEVSNVENLLEAAERVQELCEIPEDDEEEELAGENANFLSLLTASHPVVEPIEGVEDTTNEQTPILQQARLRRRVQLGEDTSSWCYSHPVLRRVVSWLVMFRKRMQLLAVAFDLPYVVERVWHFIQNEVTLYILPALAVSAFLFYHLGNPPFKIFSNDATISWWILFIIRNYMTLQLAYGSEYVLVDVLAQNSTVLIDIVGPLVTLYIITAKGWPLVLLFWGMWSLTLIQNVDSWMAWTGIEMFSSENYDGGIVNCETYLEVLVSMIMVAALTTIKRAVIALYFGKRVYIHYKKKLERVMLEMLFITEVSDLAQAIDEFEFVEEEVRTSRKMSTKEDLAQTFKNSTMLNIAQNQLRRNSKIIENDSEDEDKDNEELDPAQSADEIEDYDKREEQENPSPLKTAAPNWNDLRRNANAQSDTSDASAPEVGMQPAQTIGQGAEGPEGNVAPPVQSVNEPVRHLLRNTSTVGQIKSLLYRWEEPVNMSDKEIEDPTLNDILQFRRALLFLEDSHPFGLSFGPAHTRDSCIKSAKALYKRLLELAPEEPVLHFDVIGVLAYNDDSFDERKAKQLVKLFRPDKNDGISLLAFIQSCDSAYKKLRYLRASTSNSQVIDKVLENFVSGAFNFFLALWVMTILRMNPWTLLVSMSTLLVSFSFAFGSSLANIIEGCIMIAIRRPFDLGDRIAIGDASDKPQVNDPGYNATWIVQDCNLFTTTLRLSKSNEIATVKNGSIADKKIINHNRSDRAVVNITLSLKSSVTHEEATIIKSAIEHYIHENPRVWAGLINFRIVEVDPANDLTKVAIRAQHQRTWQDMLPVLTAKGDLIKFCTEVLIQLNAHYDNTPTTINEVFVKELPEECSTPGVLSQPEL